MEPEKTGTSLRRWCGRERVVGTLLALGASLAGLGVFPQALIAASDAENATRLVEAGRYAEAVPALQKTATSDPRNAGIQMSLGIAYQHLGRYGDAARAFETAAQIRPDLAQAHRSLALVREALAEADQRARAGSAISPHWEKARAAWERYQATDPSPAAQEMAGRHLAKIRSLSQ